MTDDIRTQIREALQAAVDHQAEPIPDGEGGEMIADGFVVSWVAIMEIARPGGEGWQWFTSGDSADAGRTFQSREEGLLRYGLRQVDRTYRDYEEGDQ